MKGRCKPGRATTYQNAGDLNAMGGTVIWILLLVQTAFIVQPQSRQMALNIFAPHVACLHSCKQSKQKLAETEHSLAQCKITQKNSCPKGNSKMQRERPRMSSRQGSSRGRSATQRPVNSPSSSVGITSEQNRGSNRLMRGWREIPDCGHLEHPAVHYRIPCTLENNTLIVSVMVEHCNNLRGPPDNLNVPMVDMQVPTVDMPRPTKANAPQATQAADAGYVDSNVPIL